MIEVKNLRKVYRSAKTEFTALDGINIKIKKGEIYGFIGLSGAGKTTFARCISFIEPVDEGSIIIDNQDFVKLRPKQLRLARQQIGVISQNFNLLMNKTVYKNIAFGLEISGKSKTYIEEKVSELLDLVGLTDKKNSYPANLSGGQKQRVSIARALAMEPKILICDEATSALDPTTTDSILALIKDINKKIGITIVIITHEMDVIKKICDKVAVMDSGKIIEKGDVLDVAVSPKTPLAKAFFGTIEDNLKEEAYDSLLINRDNIYKLIFKGEGSTDPFISQIIKKFDVEAAILAGNIEQVNGVIIGKLVVQIDGTPENIESSKRYLIENNVEVGEVI